MLRLITGSAASDLSEATVSQMVSEATRDIERKFIIIVPEQFTLKTQQRLATLHPRHACMNIDVMSFDRLAHVVLSKLGKDVTAILDDVGKALVLRNVLEDIGDDLEVYGSKIHLPGFIEEVKSLVTEFRQYGIDDNALYLMQDGTVHDDPLLYSKLQDIRLIYRHFNEAIADKYNTAEEVLDIFAGVADSSEFIRGSSIYLDGFTGFTPIQYRLIGKMLKTADITCSVIIPDDRIRRDCPEYDLFYLPSGTIFRLKDIAEEEGIETVTSHVNDAEREAAKVMCIPCSNTRAEAELAAGEILRLVREEGVRFRDIAVLTSDMEGYQSMIRDVFARAGISAFIDYKTEINGNLLVRFIMAAADISMRGLFHDQMFTFLKTGLTDITADELSLLENYCLEFNIRGRGRWESGFAGNRELPSGKEAWDLEEINDIRKRAVLPILNFYGRTGGAARKVSLLCMCLKNLLEDYDVRSRIEEMAARFTEEGMLTLGRQYEQIYDQVIALIDKISMLLGDKKMSASEFAGMLESGINEIRISTIPPSVDALEVGDLTRTRLGKVSHLFILGMNDGNVPSAGSGSALFTQRERELLRKDFEIAPTILENLYIQRYYLYLAFNRPSSALYLTYAGSSLSGEQLSASCVLEDLDELIPGLERTERSARFSGRDDLWRNKAAQMAADEIRSLADGTRTTGSGLLEYFAAAEPQTVRLLARGAAFTNAQSALDGQTALDLYGEVLKGSVSRYETYYMCPYRQFLSYGLRLEKRREFKVEAADLGTIYHDALEKYSKRIRSEGFSFRDIGDEDSHRIIADCVSDAIEENGSDILSSSARNEHFKDRIAEITGKTTDILRAHVRAGLFEPDEFEFSFSEQISDDVMFRGKIDRIDIYDADDVFVKIIDYKSGGKKFSVRDIYTGLQLQLAAYMNSAVRKVEERYPGRNVVPGGIYYYLVNDKYVKPEDAEDKYRMSGLTLAEEDVIHAMDQGLGTDGNMSSTIIPVALTKNGIHGRSITAGRSEFASLISFADRKITDAGEAIRSGDISLAPYRENEQHNGCSFCDYKDICKFEAGSFGTDWRVCSADNEEIKEAVYGRDQME